MASSILHRLLELGNPIHIIKNLWNHRFLIEQMVRRDIGQRYRGSFLGLLWSFINPLVMLLIYTFVFSLIFKARWGSATTEMPLGEYAIALFAGLIPFNVFSEVANRAPTIILNYPNYVKKVVFPLEVLPLVLVGTALFTSIVSIGILVVASIAFLGVLKPTIIFLPLIYLPLIFLSLGIGWFLASVGVYIRDVGQAIPLVMQVLLFMSPILYPIENVPDKFQVILRINPLAMIVENFRNLLLYGNFFSLRGWLIWLVITIFIALLGYLWFEATKRGFADVL